MKEALISMGIKPGKILFPISSGVKVPEATGVITGCIFLMVSFIMIPFTYSDYLLEQTTTPFPHSEFVQLIAALLSISCMLLLGFADDVLDLRWRHKLLLPSMASLPLLMVYYVTTNRTEIFELVSMGNCPSCEWSSLYSNYSHCTVLY